MKKYRGTYRVSSEFDMEKLTPTKQGYMIICKGDAYIYRYDNEYLIYERESLSKGERRNKFMNCITKLGIECQEHGWESIKFKESDLSKVVNIFKIKTYGANVSPDSKRNLRFFEWYRRLYLNK